MTDDAWNELMKTAPAHWAGVTYAAWENGECPDMPMIWFGDDLIKWPMGTKYIKQSNGKYELVVSCE